MNKFFFLFLKLQKIALEKRGFVTENDHTNSFGEINFSPISIKRCIVRVKEILENVV